MEYSTGNPTCCPRSSPKRPARPPGVRPGSARGPARIHVEPLASRSAGLLLRRERHADAPRQLLALGDLYLDGGRKGDGSCCRQHGSRPRAPAADGRGSIPIRLRLRLVAAGLRGPAGLFRLGYGGQYVIVFRDLGGRRDDLVHGRERRTARSSPADLRHRRTPDPAGGRFLTLSLPGVELQRLLDVVTERGLRDVIHRAETNVLRDLADALEQPVLSSNSAPRENASVMPFLVGLITAKMRRFLKPRMP